MQWSPFQVNPQPCLETLDDFCSRKRGHKLEKSFQFCHKIVCRCCENKKCSCENYLQYCNIFNTKSSSALWCYFHITTEKYLPKTLKKGFHQNWQIMVKRDWNFRLWMKLLVDEMLAKIIWSLKPRPRLYTVVCESNWCIW